MSIFPVHLTNDIVCNWPGIFEYFSFQFPVRNMNVDCIFEYYFLLTRLDKKLSNNSYFFDATFFIFKHKTNVTFPNVDLLLNNQHLIIKSIYDIIPSFSSNEWFKTKYHQELNDLKIISNINTYENEVYHNLLQNYVKLSRRIEDQINRFSTQHFTSYFIIGLQIRTGNMPDRTEKGAVFYKDDHSDTVIEALRIYNELLSLNITSKMYMFILISNQYRFLVTDNVEIKQVMSSKYPYILTYNSSIGHSEKESIQRYSQVAADSLIEMYLLSRCDIIVKTHYSSFGGMAKLIGGHY